MKKSLFYGLFCLLFLLAIGSLAFTAGRKTAYRIPKRKENTADDTAWTKESTEERTTAMHTDTASADNYYNRSLFSVKKAVIAGKIKDIAQSAETNEIKVKKAKKLYEDAYSDVQITDVRKLKKEFLAALEEQAEENNVSLDTYMENSFGMSLKEFREAVMKAVAKEVIDNE